MFEYLFEKVNGFYENLFYKYGEFVNKYHKCLIIITIIVNITLSFGLFKLNLLTDSDDLYSIVDSEAKRDERLLKTIFKSNETIENNYYMHQLIDFGSWAEINFHVNPTNIHNDDPNILKYKYLNEIKEINNEIINNVFVIYNNVTYNYTHVCARRRNPNPNYNECFIDGQSLLDNQFIEFLKRTSTETFELYDDMQQQSSSSSSSSLSQKSDSNDNKQPFEMKTIYFGPSGISELKYNLGKLFRYLRINQQQVNNATTPPTNNDNNNNNNSSTNEEIPAYAELFKLRYSLKSDFENMDIIVKLWELEFLKYIKIIKPKYTTFTYSVSQSLELEMIDNIKLDMYLISSTFILITMFATMLMSLKSNKITSPGILLPMTGILSSIFAVISSIGFVSLIGYPACNLIFVIPFLILGIGIDDMFIIYASFQHTNVNLETKDRICEALRKAGVSITITSLTDFVAFLVGLSASFKSVKIFCVYAAFAILFCYINQLTFFCSWLVVHSNRIKAKRHSILFCIQYNHDDKTVTENKDANKSISNKDNHETTSSPEVIPLENNGIIMSSTINETPYSPTTTALSSNNNNNNNDDDNNNKMLKTNRRKESKNILLKSINWLKNIISTVYKFLISNKYGKMIVCLIFIVYISLSVWSASKIREGIDVGDLVADKSYFRAYIKDNLKSIDMLPIVMLCVYEPIDYKNRSIRSKLDYVIKEANNLNGIKKDFLFNWMDFSSINTDLVKWRKTNNDSVLHEIIDELKYTPFKNDAIIKYNNKTNRTNIVASRYYLQYEKLNFNSLDAKPMNELRDLCKQSQLPIIPYSVTFKYYEQFEQTLPNVIQSFVIAVEAMYLISLIFVPDLLSTICIVLSMISIMIGLVGCMNAWDLTLSSVTMIQLVMSVGFCVDFSAHLTHAFIASVGKGDRTKRAHAACMRTGMPIFNSAISTIIGVCVLGFCQSYIFISFFKTMFLVMCLGLLNSMLFLPVLLSFIGPHWSRHKDKIIKINDSNNNNNNNNNNNKEEEQQNLNKDSNTILNNHINNSNHNNIMNMNSQNQASNLIKNDIST